MTRTEVVIFETHFSVAHKVGIPVRDWGNVFLERPGGANVGSQGWAKYVHGVCLLDEYFARQERRSHPEYLFGPIESCFI
jgi:hypothetical protein